VKVLIFNSAANDFISSLGRVALGALALIIAGFFVYATLFSIGEGVRWVISAVNYQPSEWKKFTAIDVNDGNLLLALGFLFTMVIYIVYATIIGFVGLLLGDLGGAIIKKYQWKSKPMKLSLRGALALKPIDETCAMKPKKKGFSGFVERTGIFPLILITVFMALLLFVIFYGERLNPYDGKTWNDYGIEQKE